MANKNFDRCLLITLYYEGLFSNNSHDPGGATMRGITQREYNIYRRKKGEAFRNVRFISDPELHDIYLHCYWDVMKCGDYPAGIDLCMFDACVNSGEGRAKTWLLKSGNDINRYCDLRHGFLRHIPGWRFFGRGWNSRVDGIRKKALAMKATEK